MLDDNDYKLFLNLFDKVPEKILCLFSKEFPEVIEPLLSRYVNIIDEHVVQKNFDYAETVAAKMRKIYLAGDNKNLKIYALKSILCAAVDLNRFRAMDVFNKILISIKLDDEAFIVANMIKENFHRYLKIYSQIPKKELHSIIQCQWENACRYNQTEV